jgi:hypothetical protein
MAYETDYFAPPGLAAQGDLSSYQHRVMQPTGTAGRVKLSQAATNTAVGILMNKPTATGYAATVAMQGMVPALAGTSVGFSYGERVTWNSTGVIPANTSVPGTKKTLGWFADTVTPVSGTTLVTIYLDGGSKYVSN